MKKEDYVSLEVAKLLKEKGFGVPCLSQYTERGTIWNCQEPENFNATEGCYSRPTLYEAAKWFRENHNIHIDVKCTAYFKPLNRCDYICEIFALSSHQFIDTEIYHKYEEALNAGIHEALKLI